jgi:uncharacterized protein (DUF305 family)
MNRLHQALVLGSTVATFAMGACLAATAQGTPTSVQPQGAPGMTPAQLAELNGGIPPFTAADARFMSSMIGHHAQAIVMSSWAQSHGASSSVRTLCERIVVSQQDEIKYMQSWLADRHETVPEADPRGYMMPGMDHPMLMPGMLTPEQMASLDRSRGARFDRLFLTGMIAHHRGALDMVHQLMTSAGAAQDAGLFAYATDVQAGQAAEIDRMQRMLAEVPPEGSHANAAR